VHKANQLLGSTGFIPFLLALQGNMTILGLTGDTANSWALQDTLHALALLEHGNLSCIPVALGESYVSWNVLYVKDMFTDETRCSLS